MMDGAISGKTGFTGDAGYCYVGALQSEGRTFVVALLACGWPNNKNYKWTDTRKLMEYGMAHYRYAEVWKIPELSKIPGGKQCFQKWFVWKNSSGSGNQRKRKSG